MKTLGTRIVGFEDGEMWPKAKQCKWYLETRKGKEIDSSLDSLESKIVLLTPQF